MGFVLVILGSLLPVQAAAVTITDDFGTTITLEQPARRIICLYGALNEILVDMGLAHRIVARTKADTFCPALAEKPSIGTHMRPNVEMVVGLKPDLVLQMAGRKGESEPVNAIAAQGIPTACFRVQTMDDLYILIDRLGVITGARDQADRMTATMRERLERVRKRLGPDPKRPRVFFEVRYPNLLTAGRASIVSEIIHLAGGTNCVFLNKKLVRLSEEELVGLNPEVYLVQKGPMNPNPVPVSQRSHFRTLQAVRSGAILEVDEHLFSRPGPRTVDAVELLADVLHPGE
jgi:iron complex transport system substrate-binding protein